MNERCREIGAHIEIDSHIGSGTKVITFWKTNN